MADGRGERWNNYLGAPKHLIRFAGERLLDRAVRLFRCFGATDLLVSARDERYEVSGAARVVPAHNEVETDKFFSIKDWWNRSGETIIVYGDCFFTREAVRTIMSTSSTQFPGGIVFFGRFGPSKFTGKNWGEIFAVRVSDHDSFERACSFVRDGLEDGTIERGGGWEIYRTLAGLPPNGEHQISGNFVEIDDYTDDFDFPVDYHNFLDRWGSRSRVIGSVVETVGYRLGRLFGIN